MKLTSLNSSHSEIHMVHPDAQPKIEIGSAAFIVRFV